MRGGRLGDGLDRGHVWLMPRNAADEPIAGDDAVIRGKVVAVLRSL
ncbi:hypothetical protein ACFWGM_16800 [Streptomyces roseolus]